MSLEEIIVNNNENKNEEEINNDIDDKSGIDLYTIKKRLLINTLAHFYEYNIKENQNFYSKKYYYQTTDNNSIENDIYEEVKQIVFSKLYKLKFFIAKKKTNYHLKILKHYTFDENYPKKIEKLILSQQIKSIEFIVIKSLIISLMSFMNELIKDFMFVCYAQYENNELDCDFLNEIYDQFEIIQSNIPLIETDFAECFKLFRKKYLFDFCLVELFKEIFWDSIFRVNTFCYEFIKQAQKDDVDELNETTNKTFRNIFSILWNITFSLKRQVSELLDIQDNVCYKIDLINFIDDQKKRFNNSSDFPQAIKTILFKIIDYDELKIFKKCIDLNNELLARVDIDSLCNKKTNDNLSEQLVDEYQIITNELAEFSYEEAESDDDINKVEISTENNSSNRSSNYSNDNKSFIENSVNIESENSIIDNNNNNNNQTEYKSIDELYKYINDTNENKCGKKKNKRKNKKRNKNKKLNNNDTYMENEKILEENKSQIQKDIIYEDFKRDMSIYFINNKKSKKIKPLISSNWLCLLKN